jgi:uncharacterized OB-fold protein
MATSQIAAYVCGQCGWADFQLVAKCPRCHGDIRESAFAGTGKIETFTTIRYPPKGFENEAPYVVAIINIENGPRVIGRVSNSADGVKIGSTVTLKSYKRNTLEFQLSKS